MFSSKNFTHLQSYSTITDHPGCGILIFCGTLTPALKNPQTPRLWVKVGHRLLNLCDCDSVLSERCRQRNSQDFSKNNNHILLLSYLNLISVTACSKTVHKITKTKLKLLVYVQSSCTKIIRHCNKYIKIQKQSYSFDRTPTLTQHSQDFK